MSKFFLVVVMSLILVIIPAAGGCSCTQSAAGAPDNDQRIAEEFVRQEATYRFDGIPETFRMTGAIPLGDGGKYSIDFDSRHSGYGDRNGQMPSGTITHHTAEIIVQNGAITAAVMDGIWDMFNQRMLHGIETRPAAQCGLKE
ncbi:MAG: hypothetical protein JXA46_16155 [Dehalococcoidales bacterium]|nr:hypothetical protein [Dehalococcoidales bacterium]